MKDDGIGVGKDSLYIYPSKRGFKCRNGNLIIVENAAWGFLKEFEATKRNTVELHPAHVRSSQGFRPMDECPSTYNMWPTSPSIYIYIDGFVLNKAGKEENSTKKQGFTSVRTPRLRVGRPIRNGVSSVSKVKKKL